MQSQDRGNKSVFRESDVFGLFGKLIFGSSQEMSYEFVSQMLGILTGNVAMVLIKVLAEAE